MKHDQQLKKVIADCNIGNGFCHSTSDFKSNFVTITCNRNHFPLHGKHFPSWVRQMRIRTSITWCCRYILSSSRGSRAADLRGRIFINGSTLSAAPVHLPVLFPLLRRPTSPHPLVWWSKSTRMHPVFCITERAGGRSVFQATVMMALVLSQMRQLSPRLRDL